MMAPMGPTIGITVDNRDNSASSLRYESSIGYSRAVAELGGIPLLLPHEPELARAFVDLCDGIILTGGVDPQTEAFGEPMHPKARPIDPRRQLFELALLDALAERNDKPALGVCLGMQLMALHARGRLNQYMPESMGLDDAAKHQKDSRHVIHLKVDDSILLPGGTTEELQVVSYHQQAVSHAGTMRVVATAPDGVIEAIDDPTRRFYVGVQWHPERGSDGLVNRDLLRRFVGACH